MLENLSIIVQPDMAKTIFFTASGLLGGLFLTTYHGLLPLFLHRNALTVQENRKVNSFMIEREMAHYITIHNLTVVVFALATIVLISTFAVIVFSEREIIEPSAKMVLGLLTGSLIGHLVLLFAEKNSERTFALVHPLMRVLTPRRIMLIIFASLAAWMMNSGVSVVAAISFLVVSYLLECSIANFVEWWRWRNALMRLGVERSEFMMFVEQQLEAEDKDSLAASANPKSSDKGS